MSRLLAPLLLLASTVAFGAPTSGRVSVVDPWVRLPPPGARNTGAFLTLRNAGPGDARVVKASNPASRVTELHTHLEEVGVMKMRPVPFIEVKAGAETVLKPGGLHVMLIDLLAPLKEGEVLALTLVFEDGSSTVVQAPVRKLELGAMPR